MTTAIIQNFEKMLADGEDNTLLRFSLGSEYLKAGDPVRRSRPQACSASPSRSIHSMKRCSAP